MGSNTPPRHYGDVIIDVICKQWMHMCRVWDIRIKKEKKCGEKKCLISSWAPAIQYSQSGDTSTVAQAESLLLSRSGSVSPDERAARTLLTDSCAVKQASGTESRQCMSHMGAYLARNASILFCSSMAMSEQSELQALVMAAILGNRWMVGGCRGVSAVVKVGWRVIAGYKLSIRIWGVLLLGVEMWSGVAWGSMVLQLLGVVLFCSDAWGCTVL